MSTEELKHRRRNTLVLCNMMMGLSLFLALFRMCNRAILMFT